AGTRRVRGRGRLRPAGGEGARHGDRLRRRAPVTRPAGPSPTRAWTATRRSARATSGRRCANWTDPSTSCWWTSGFRWRCPRWRRWRPGSGRGPGGLRQRGERAAPVRRLPGVRPRPGRAVPVGDGAGAGRPGDLDEALSLRPGRPHRPATPRTGTDAVPPAPAVIAVPRGRAERSGGSTRIAAAATAG